MAFNIGLSGIRAASTDLEVTGNNVANASTVGFKESRAEFADVYTSTLLGTGLKPVGSGVLVDNVRHVNHVCCQAVVVLAMRGKCVDRCVEVAVFNGDPIGPTRWR